MFARKRGPTRRGRPRPWIAVCALGALLAARAGAATYYELNGPYRLGTGMSRFRGPVDVATGAFMVRFPLSRIPARVPIALSWLYTSQEGSNGPFGKGTSLSCDFFIAQSPVLTGQPYELVAPGGHHFVFDGVSGSDKIDTRDPEILGAKLHFTSTPPSNLSSTLRWKNGDVFTFNSSGALVQVADRHGNSVSITRNIQGFATRVAQGQYRGVSLVYSPTTGKLTKATIQYANGSPLNRDWNIA